MAGLTTTSCPVKRESAQRLALDLFFDNLQDPIIATSLATVPQDLSVELLKKIRADSRFDSGDKTILGAQTSLVRAGKIAVSSESESLVYARACLACHGVDGLGQPGLAPPLNDPAWLGKSKEELISIVLNGLEEPIQVNEETWNQSMPAWRALLSDADIAEVLNDIQRRFNPNPQIFTKEKVRLVRTGE
jgi:cytochrome c553